MPGERVGVLGGALALTEVDAIWSAVVADECGLGGRGRGRGGSVRRVVAEGPQRGEERRVRLRGILPDHGHDVGEARGPGG